MQDFDCDWVEMIGTGLKFEDQKLRDRRGSRIRIDQCFGNAPDEFINFSDPDCFFVHSVDDRGHCIQYIGQASLNRQANTYELDKKADDAKQKVTQTVKKRKIKQRSKVKTVQQRELKRNGKAQKNPAASKIFLLFFWKKMRNFIQESGRITSFDWWREIELNSGSMNELNLLFIKEEAQLDLQNFFSTKRFYRSIMTSSIDFETKKTYLRYLRIVGRGYHRRCISHLN